VRNYNKIFLFILISTLFLLPFIYADEFSDTLQITWEKTKEPFFNKYNPFGSGARALGMGEAFAAIADDASAVYYNPAGLPQLDHNELYWTGSSFHRNTPYSDFATLIISLGTQYFGISYFKPYHPKGRWPDNIDIPKVIGPSTLFPDSLYPDQDLIIPAGKYERWYGDLEPSWQEFLSDKYRKYINLPFQENQILVTYATPLTGDKSFMLGLNVKYLFTDADAKKVLGDNYDAWAWGLDLGFLYKLRIIEHLKDFNIGIMLRDVSGSMKRYKTGIEKNLFFTSTLGISIRTTELIEKEITSFSFDWDSVNDPGVLQNEKNRLKFGFEQWFLDSHFALRGGLVNFMYPGPWRMSFGLSARYWLGIDYAYVRAIPFDQKAENEDESHWFSVYWIWGVQKKKLPTPDVFAAVEPISFAPKNGETVIFKLNAYSKAGIDRWALNILDKNNNLVKTYVDIGVPPSQIVWNGTDNKYQLLPDGEYTFIFEATDKIGSTSSTPVQIVKIYTPVLEAVDKTALEQLKKLLNQIKDRDLAEDNAMKAKAEKDIAALKKAKEKPTPVPPPGPAQEPAYTTLAPALPGVGTGAPQQMSATAGGPISIIGFPNIESGLIKSAYITTTNDGQRMFNMEYMTENTMPKYVLQEMSLMIKSIAENLGYSINQIGINSVYGGNNNLSLTVPIAQAQNFAKGIISVEQMLRGSSVTLNGEIINPNF
jgi:hypothetical protein